jgi:hypothetical protein
MIREKFELLQVLIDKCVKHDYDVVREALSMKWSYLNSEQRPDYLRKEIFRVTEELVAMNQKVPALQAFAFDWNIPDFIWETTFYENLTLDERKEYIAFPYETFNGKLYIEKPTSYDDQLPYLSVIIKMVVYSKYLKDLQKAEKEILHAQEPTITEPEIKENIPPKRIVGKDNPFNCKLDGDAILLLTACVNEAHVFTTDITPQILENFFYCRLDGALKSKNNRLLAYFMMKLSMHEYITYEWQSVIANNKLVFAPQKDKYLNNSDLSTANDNIKYIAPKKSEIIDKFIKQLQKH